ncbi:MAG: hypothetical protein D6755_13910, partial [Anaerolineae bacterium]
GSPAIDAGTNAGCPATDQRGATRPADGNHDATSACDIGAYETEVPIQVIPGPNGGNGPGGVGITDGSSTLELWLKGDAGAFANTSCTIAVTSGHDVACWQDQSGNNRTMTQPRSGQLPTYNAHAVNGQPALHFTEREMDYLQNNTNVALGAGDDTFTYFATWFPNVTNQAVIFEQNTTAKLPGRRAALLQINNYYGFNGESNDAHIVPYTPGTWILTSLLLNGAATNNVHIYHYGTPYTGTIDMNVQNVGTDQMLVGKKSNDSPLEYFDGDIPEIIVFSNTLSDTERILVENYLSAKYGLSLSANDLYAGDDALNGDFDLDVAGIGQYGGTQHTQA